MYSQIKVLFGLQKLHKLTVLFKLILDYSN